MAPSPCLIPLAHFLPVLTPSTRRGPSSDSSVPPPTSQRECAASCAPRTAPSPCLMVPLVHYLPILKPSARGGLSSDSSVPPRTSQRRTVSCAPRAAPLPCLIPLVHYLLIFLGVGP